MATQKQIKLTKTTIIIIVIVLVLSLVGLFVFIQQKEKEKKQIFQNINDILDTKSGIDPNDPDVNKGLIGVKPDQSFNSKPAITVLKTQADAWIKDYVAVVNVFKGLSKAQISKINQDLKNQEGYNLNDYLFNHIFTRCINSFGFYVGLGCTELQQIITIING